MSGGNQIVPELYCSNFERSLAFYTHLGFAIRFDRPEDRFAFLELDGAQLMIEETVDPSRRFVAAKLEFPFGRGVNLQVSVRDVEAVYAIVEDQTATILLPMEDRWYRSGDRELGQRQFVALDPDGYLLRFAQDLGSRPATSHA